MQGKIALEEHFAIDGHADGFARDFSRTMSGRRCASVLLDIHGRRVRLMDEFGIEMMILSLNAPAVQAIPDAKQANDIARKRQRLSCRAVRKRPDRFQALAALPMQDPELAAGELQRCVKDLGISRRAGQRIFAGRRHRHRSPTTT